MPPAPWPLAQWTGPQPEVGTPEWWKKNKGKAVFEPNAGYKVAGVDGYFDQNGRPIDQPVARTSYAQRQKTQVGLLGDTNILGELKATEAYDRVKTAVGLGPNETLARDKFTAGETQFRDENYRDAAELFSDAAGRTRDPDLRQDALLMLAESHFFADRYIEARDAYNALVQEFPNTKHLDRLIEHQWSIAQYWEKHHFHDPQWVTTPNVLDRTRPRFDTLGQAIRTYENIRMNDPTGPRADDAIMATAGIYFRRGRYEDADYHFTLLRQEYPRSDFQFESHVLGLQTKLRKYQGPDYDGTPLEEAKTLVRQLRTQFGGELTSEERERIRTAEAEVNRQVALRDLRMAQFYDDTKHFGAARMYYAELIDKYPESELAGQARERLAMIAGEPDEPPQRLSWLLGIVPQGREKSRFAQVPEIRDGVLQAAAETNESATASADASAAGDSSPR